MPAHSKACQTMRQTRSPLRLQWRGHHPRISHRQQRRHLYRHGHRRQCLCRVHQRHPRRCAQLGHDHRRESFPPLSVFDRRGTTRDREHHRQSSLHVVPETPGLHISCRHDRHSRQHLQRLLQTHVALHSQSDHIHRDSGIRIVLASGNRQYGQLGRDSRRFGLCQLLCLDQRDALGQPRHDWRQGLPLLLSLDRHHDSRLGNRYRQRGICRL